MRTLFALIAVGLDAAASRFSSKIEKTASAVVAGVVGIGLLASPFLVQANDEPGSVDLPTVSLIKVVNYGSTGFEPRFSLSSSFAGQGRGARLEKWHDGSGIFWRRVAVC